MRPALKPALLLGVVLLASMLTTAAGAAAHASTAAQTPKAPVVEGEIIEYDFSFPRPEDGAVPAGTEVVFTNRGTHPHTVTDRGGTFDELVMPGQSATIVAEIPGRVTFFCKISASKPGTPDPMDGFIDIRPTRRAVIARVQATDSARYGSKPGYDPPEFAVEAGATVQLANIGGQKHSITADDGSFDTGVVAPGAEGGRYAGDSAVFVAEEPGTFKFHCQVHPTLMRGVLTVRGEPPEPPVPTPVPTPAPAEGEGGDVATPPQAAGRSAATDVSASSDLFGQAWVIALLAGLGGAVIGVGVAGAILLNRRHIWPRSSR